MLRKLKAWLPWQFKIVLKVILSRIPLPYKIWSGLGIFKHGNMDEYQYAWSVINNHLKTSGKPNGISAIEFGPGDGVLSGLLAKSAGFQSLDMLDAGDFASRDINKYQRTMNTFSAENPMLIATDFNGIKTFDELLLKANSKYFISGLNSLISIPSESYDLIFSQAVLEHVRSSEFEEMLVECHRILKPDGVMSHVIDFKDHLGGGLNNLRFGSEFWEKNWFAFRSGFYTNRLRVSQIVDLCEKHKFRVKKISESRFSSLPLSRNKLAAEFQELSDDDIMCSGAHLLMEKYE